MKNSLKTFEANTKGRDFVVGDLHGNFPAFLNMLEHLNFDTEVDRMFSCGDLVDRGIDSLSCLRLISEPWFNAVLANHEQMMIEAFNGGHMGNYWFQNGGRWGMEAWLKYGKIMEARCNNKTLPLAIGDEPEIFDLVKLAAEELPFLITVNMPNGKKFHIIHAEFPPHKRNLTDADIDSSPKVFALATKQSNGGDAFLWSRYLFNDFYNADLANHNDLVLSVADKFDNHTGPFSDDLSHVISGHTIIQAPLTILGQTNIDTGAYAANSEDGWAQLTCVNLHDWTFFQATDKSFKQVQPIVVNKSDLENIWTCKSTQGK